MLLCSCALLTGCTEEEEAPVSHQHYPSLKDYEWSTQIIEDTPPDVKHPDDKQGAETL